MTGENAAIGDFVTEQKVEIKVAQRYFDGLFFSGTREQVILDHRILSTIVRRAPVKSEGRIANFVGLQMRDPLFQDSLARLESKGLIVRKTREWGLEGHWVELSDDCRQAIITNKGDHFAHQTLRQLGV